MRIVSDGCTQTDTDTIHHEVEEALLHLGVDIGEQQVLSKSDHFDDDE